MKEYLTFSDLELDFLNKLGIYFHGNCFYYETDSTYYVFNCTGSRYGVIPEFDFSAHQGSNNYIYEFKGKYGRLLFIRNDCHELYGIPSLIVKLKDFTFAIGEEKFEVPWEEVHELTDEEQKIKNNVKKVFVIVNSRKNKFSSKIKITPSVGVTLSNTCLIRGENNYIANEIISTSSKMSLYQYDIAREEIYEDHSQYDFALKQAIDLAYGNSQVRQFYDKFIPLFSQVHCATLYLPAIYEQEYRNEYEKSKESAVKSNNQIIEDCKASIEQEIADYNTKIENLDGMISKYPVEQENQKQK